MVLLENVHRMAKSSQPDPQPPDEALGLDAFRHKPEDEGLSLEQLSAAFAQMMGSGHDPYAAAAPTAPQGEPIGQAATRDADLEGEDADEATGEQPCELSPRSILEAMLFVGNPKNEPITSEQVAGLMRGVRPSEIDDLVRELNELYAANRCPYFVASEGAGYRLTLRDEFARVRDKFYGRARQARLSQAAIEVLAIVAYNEPLTADEVNEFRGTASGAILSQLVRRQLLRIERHADAPRKPRYRTTQRFLDLFKLTTLEDLPRSEEVEKR